ncbi:MAG: hypothetical protein O3B08_08180, partial [Proteobacteria bacterium]|nr:hypothetical protein [Pseudomonadota bacterium]
PYPNNPGNRRSGIGRGAAEQRRTDAAPVRRAMDNLRTALMTRLRDESADREKVHSAAEILAEAARKIERL